MITVVVGWFSYLEETHLNWIYKNTFHRKRQYAQRNRRFLSPTINRHPRSTLLPAPKAQAALAKAARIAKMKAFLSPAPKYVQHLKQLLQTTYLYLYVDIVISIPVCLHLKQKTLHSYITVSTLSLTLIILKYSALKKKICKFIYKGYML